jgi:hypothetical protein
MVDQPVESSRFVRKFPTRATIGETRHGNLEPEAGLEPALGRLQIDGFST